MTAPDLLHESLSDLIAQTRDLIRADASAAVIAEHLQAVKVLAPKVSGRRGYAKALHQIWPEARNPRQRARRIIQRAILEKEPQSAAPPALDGHSADLYPTLMQIAREKPASQARLLALLSLKLGVSVSSLRKKMRTALRDGPLALNRKRRRDAGRTILPVKAQQAFQRRRLDRSTKHEPISASIEAVRSRFPDLGCTDYPFYRLARSLPKALTMPEKQWRQTFLPVGRWETPHPNHTWAFDFTTADLFVWDGDPELKPYRPSLTAIVDECTQSCMYALYSRDAPNQEILSAVLLHAMLPKADRLWIQHGAPLYLHADNGMVQDSRWLRQVCATMGSDLKLMDELHQTEVCSPWQQGHIESFYRILHSRFESQVAGYCGNKPEHKPEGFDLSKPRSWRELLSLEKLNEILHIWIAADYHRKRHRRLKMSRLDYWQIHAPGHICLPANAEIYLRQTLMRREVRKVSRARVSVNSYVYWSELLEGYEGCRLEVRWDPGDLSKVLIITTGGQGIWADREMVGRVDRPADLAEHKRRKRAIRQQRKVLSESARYLPTAEPENRRYYERILREAQATAPIPFPKRADEAQPNAADAREQMTVEEAISWGLSEEKAESLAVNGLIPLGSVLLARSAELAEQAEASADPEEDPFELHGIPI